MQRQVVTAGGLAAASANNIVLTQTATQAGKYNLTGSLGSSTFQGTAAISGNVMTVGAVASGAVFIGMEVTGLGVSVGTIVTGLRTGTGGTGTYIVSPEQTFSSATVYGGMVATLDVARQVLITAAANETGKVFTVTGTDISGNPQSETLAGPNVSTVATGLNYKTVTSVSIGAAAVGAITVGTNGVSASRWVRLDEWAPSSVGVQCTVSGTVNYTVQTTFDNDSVTPLATTWVSSADTNVVGATATKQSYFTYAPVYARVLINSGTGTVTATFVQNSVVPK